MTDCIFCKIVSGDIHAYKIAESTNFIAFLDIQPSVIGHTLIIPKKHSTSVLDMPEYLGNEFIEFTQRVASAVIYTIKADGFNLTHNNGVAAGQAVFHTHFHLIPRKINDAYKFFESHTPMSQEQLEILRQQIIKNIQ